MHGTGRSGAAVAQIKVRRQTRKEAEARLREGRGRLDKEQKELGT